jgi:hypothetical protein
MKDIDYLVLANHLHELDRPLLGPDAGAVSLGPYPGNDGAEEHDHGRVVDPDEDDRQRAGGAVRAGRGRAARVRRAPAAGVRALAGRVSAGAATVAGRTRAARCAAAAHPTAYAPVGPAVRHVRCGAGGVRRRVGAALRIEVDQPVEDRLLDGPLELRSGWLDLRRGEVRPAERFVQRRLLGFLLDRLPAQLQVVLASRADPPLAPSKPNLFLNLLVSAVLGTKLPGPGSIYLGQDLKFLKPVAPGDTVTATVTVKEKQADKRIVTLATTCANLAGDEVLNGTATVVAPSSLATRRQHATRVRT